MPRVAPQPLDITWTCKPVESARSGVEILADGRTRCWIEHETLHSVTPAMLVWWFQHLEGEITHQGQRVERYRVWHPRDHVAVEYARRNADGSVGVGSVIHLTEMLGANPHYLVDVHSEILKLDEQGFVHRPRLHGLAVAIMEYEFQPVAGGTQYHNSLTVGFSGRLAKPLNALIRAALFDAARGQAWIKHNVEEVGNLESFLPQLYSQHGGPAAADSTRPFAREKGCRPVTCLQSA